MRNAEFDREQVLRNAMYAFMDKGYSKTSMQDLTKATGLHPGSIYCAFENKRGLLLAAIDQYHQDRSAQLQQLFATQWPFKQKLQRYLDEIVAECLSCDASQACLLVKVLTEIGEQDSDINAKASEHLQQWQQTLQSAYEQAINEGELPPHPGAEASAQFLMMGIYGLRTYAHTHPDAQDLKRLASMLTQQFF
ncbi:TetR/AcrR family transcriptional regulator [Shewanella yunxiaonensis]|uniref:TetR/AcrR family transcriptional regulator n=1 Tax=Shewanella yunxiaonensis TaxID=2829809 RepID=A0ABX7YQL3_9GAMM|nr:MULTISPECIES: TetR/AcrR family transcriptional regulator [Shewanella]MDF0534792.1 TetR/AcrR family transcriptional regulator [Shewanella sp. A32]QUN04808.1 TetR/AcrR family transcriptional regulator [Shewanella yunxiaonensis]